jgi:sulfotransferase family protein
VTTTTFSSDPVLLGGENRSGTTLLSVVLDSHPDLVVGPEIDFPEPVNLGPHVLQICDLLEARHPRVIGRTKADIDPNWFDTVHFVRQCERFGLSLADVRQLVHKVMKQTGSDITSLPDRCRLINEIGEVRRVRTGATRWGLKLQRKIQNIEAYAALWPNAHFIHIIRDGRDLAASHLKTVPEWGYRTVAEAARGWLDVVSRPHRNAPAGRYLEVRYEDLVTHPRQTILRMLDYLGLHWNEAVLRHAEHKHALFDNPFAHPAAEDAGKPIHPGRTGRYSDDLTGEEIEIFERIAGAELDRHSYRRSGVLGVGANERAADA